jgi:hypothetical protein
MKLTPAKEEIASGLKFLLYTHEDLSSNPGTPAYVNNSCSEMKNRQKLVDHPA